ILNRGTITGPGPFGSAGVEGGAMKILSDDLVRFGSGVSDPARQLFHVEPRPIQGENLVRLDVAGAQKAEIGRRLLSELLFASIEGDRAAVHPAGRAGLKTAHGKSEPAQ